jgi:hypothetical protein
MITTILAVVALSGSLAPAAKPEFQAQTDYGQALKLAANEKKPMAVLIGKGDAFAKLMADGGLTAEAKKTLAEKFVCVTVDVGTKSGAELAGQFDLADGLVISSAGGTHQALRHVGAVTATDLAKHTATYATATGMPVTTVTAGAAPVTSTSFYLADTTAAPAAAAPAVYSSAPVMSGCPNGNCGTPIIRSSPFASTPYYSIGGTGGCPNGRCPLPR